MTPQEPILDRAQTIDEERQLVKRAVTRALDSLFRCDALLFELDANERSISHRLALYLQLAFGTKWNVDCEYNRHDHLPKLVTLPRTTVAWDDADARTIYPDIIVHRRRTDAYNLLAIEMKKEHGGPEQLDLAKLEAMRSEPLAYRYTLFIRLPAVLDPDRPKLVNEIWQPDCMVAL